MALKFYMWKMDDSTGQEPVKLGGLRVRGRKLEWLELAPPELIQLVEGLRARPTLPLRFETTSGAGPTLKRVVTELEVTPSDPRYGCALSDAVGREGGYYITYDPYPPF